MRIPPVALVLGVSGLIPFLWGVMALRFGALPLPGIAPREATLAYGLMIFCFMAGTHWGFAAKGGWALGYALSVAPFLGILALVLLLRLPVNLALIAGFVALLPLDALFQRRGLAPPWWIRLRLGLSVVVIACLVAVWQVG